MDQPPTPWCSVFFTTPDIPRPDNTLGIEGNLITLFNEAKTSIDVAVFEFNLENVAQALICAHNRGVTVRVVYDSQFAGEGQQIAEIIATGIPAVGDNRSAFMHNKFFIIDRKIVWTGSFNITKNASERNNENATIIYDAFLAKNYSLEFEEMFAGRFGRSSPVNTVDSLTVQGVRVENYFAPEKEVMIHISKLVKQATRYVHFLAFSFTSRGLSTALKEGMRRGVEVAGVFESRGTDHPSSEYRSLREAGAEVLRDKNPGTMHHKVIVIDGQVVIFGSYNFSDNAEKTNDENILIIFNPAIAARYEAEFQRIRDLARSQWRKKKTTKRS